MKSHFGPGTGNRYALWLLSAMLLGVVAFGVSGCQVGWTRYTIGDDLYKAVPPELTKKP